MLLYGAFLVYKHVDRADAYLVFFAVLSKKPYPTSTSSISRLLFLIASSFSAWVFLL